MNKDFGRAYTWMTWLPKAAGTDVVHIGSECGTFQPTFQLELQKESAITPNGWHNVVTKSYPAVFHSNGGNNDVWQRIHTGLQVFPFMTGHELADRHLKRRIASIDI